MGNSLQSVTGGALATGLGALAMLRAAAEDTVAAFDPLHVTGADGPPADPFDARDPEYIRATLPALRTMSDIYFRADVSGLQRIPESGPVPLVGNHSGGTMIADTFVFAQSFYDRFGPDRRFHQLAHDLVFGVPGLRTLVQRFGTVPASPANMRRALDRDAALLVYPGGTRRASGRPGRRARSASPAGRGSSSWRWSATSRSFPWCRWAGRRPGSSWAADAASPAPCRSTGSPGSRSSHRCSAPRSG